MMELCQCHRFHRIPLNSERSIAALSCRLQVEAALWEYRLNNILHVCLAVSSNREQKNYLLFFDCSAVLVTVRNTLSATCSTTDKDECFLFIVIIERTIFIQYSDKFCHLLNKKYLNHFGFSQLLMR